MALKQNMFTDDLNRNWYIIYFDIWRVYRSWTFYIHNMY